ncbi:MAG TPA: DUF1345 domain-containing protein, partial [Polyangiaceae bacterium]
HRPRRIDPRRAIARALIAFVCGIAAHLLVAWRLPPVAATLVGWNVGSLVLLALSWTVIGPADAHATRERAGSEDPGRTLVYVVVILASTASLVAATVTVRDAHTPPMAALCLVTVALAWALTHTAFTFRYARLYYRADAEGVGGVELPGHHPPTYFDFAYFAFTIGMCFQVSDVCVVSAQIRRAVLLHAVISFAYNSAILAFVLNLVFGMAA